MASRLQQFQTKAAQISEFMTKNGTSYYKELMEKNNTYIKEPSNIETCQMLEKQLFYTRLASNLGGKEVVLLFEVSSSNIMNVRGIPRRYEAFWKELNCLKEFLKTREAWNIENASMAALIGVECYAWFYGGEIIGRGFTIKGYHV
ncbi:Mitochondrial ATP synthase subunit G protein isoform 2 [Hibiscus syriacus]|uniref:Mitochondrial ATP synthase subunit G protein isoform 2 n=1 Tax=Hibiscus syriacus TaxID=106335 RepID=A0A6A2WNZ1_HIBSY|nr:Mitochondrial ATP synthase subunit G protein isoform 2 [Hibiscus syriacus]